MPITAIGTNHALTVKRWATALTYEAERKSYWRKFMGTDNKSPIKVLKELSKNKGDRITTGLRMHLRHDGVEGDATLEGTSAEAALSWFDCAVSIDQRRSGTHAGSRMSQQRVMFNIRSEARDALAEWWGADFDQQLMIYISGLRGIDSTLHSPLAFTGRAGNAVEAPDAGHIIYGGDATGWADLATGDTMSLDILERLGVIAAVADPLIQPITVDGESRFVLLMHPFQAYSLRKNVSTNDWIDIHKNTDGGNSPIYKGGLGMYNGIVMHEHRNVIRMDDTLGNGLTIPAARALFIGTQAALLAFTGETQESSMVWHEETDDRGNQMVFSSSCIYGVKKARYDNKDFGVIAVDTAAANPNA